MRTPLLMALLGICSISFAQNPEVIHPQNLLNNQILKEKGDIQKQDFQSEKTNFGNGAELPGQNNFSIVTNDLAFEESKNINTQADNFAPQQVISIPQGWSGISGFIIPDIPGIETLFKPVMDKFVILYNQDGMFYPDQNINTLVNWNPQSGYIAKFNQPASLGLSGQVNSNKNITLNAGWNLIPVLSNCPVNVAEFFQNQDMVVVKDVATYKLYWPTMSINTLNELLPGKAYYVLMNTAGVITFPDCTVPAWQCGEPFVDPRDSRVYNTVQIGAQCWMAQNLNFGSRVSGNTLQTNNETPEKYCYNDHEANCYIFGGLYQWNEMMQYTETPGTQGLCPEGWYIPNDAEWTWLANYLGGVASAGGALKEAGTTHWSTPNTGATNSSGFTALPGGTRDLAGSFSNQNFFGNFWTSTGVDADLSTRRILAYNQAQITVNSHNKETGLSVRCRKRETLQITPESQTVDNNAGSVTFEIMSSTAWTVEENVSWFNVIPMSGTGNITLTVTYDANIPEESRSGDITITAAGASPVVIITITQLPFVWSCGNPIEDARDGKIYPTVQIGNQCWMAQNLNIGILTSEFDNQNNNSTIEKYCIGNDTANCDIYGGLYQWDEMMQYSNGFGLKGICPEGWHLPSATEWDILTNTLDGTFLAGSKLKTTGTIEEGTGLWYAPNSGADNSSGFSMLPASFRQAEGGIAEPGYFSMMWSTDYNSALPPTYVALNDTPEFFYINSEMTYGNSVRCIMNDANHKFTEISPSRSEVPAQAGSYVFTVNSNTGWTVSENASWLTVTPDSGINNGQIIVIYEANSITEAREAVILVQSESQIIELYLTQAAFIPLLAITPTSKFITSSAGSETFEVTSNTSWTVTENVSWFYFSPTTGNNNAILTLTYETNPGPDQRVGQFSIATTGGNPLVTVTVIQNGTCGIITDQRDGKTYATVQIGIQCWMAQNLNIGTRINGGSNQTNNTTIEKYCNNNSEANCDVYGGLYQWNELMQYSTTQSIQGICPLGWHIPSDAEWTTLSDFVGSQIAYLCNNNSSYIAKALAASTNWTTYTGTCIVGNNLNANNATGFTGLPGGGRFTDGSLDHLSFTGIWWSSTMNDDSLSWYRALSCIFASVTRNSYGKAGGFSVRCLKDETTTSQLEVTPSNQDVTGQAGTATFNILSNTSWTITEDVSWLYISPTNGSGNRTITINYEENTESTPRIGEITIIPASGNPIVVVTVTQAGWSCGNSLTDSRDGKAYTTVQIGTQCWMAQNLNIGTRINGGSNQTNNGNIEKYCYNNSESNCDIYGGLYQWNEMMQYSTTPGVQGICPQGWHVPSDGEWSALSSYLGGESVAGGKMKSTGTFEAGTGLWYSPNTGATNSSGFTGLPGGYRDTDGSFYDQSSNGYWWSSTQGDASNAWYRYLYYINAAVSRNFTNKTYGFSVRCLKDETTSSQLEVSPINQDVTAQSGTTTFNISSNNSWTVSKDVTWISVSPTNGSENGTLTVTYDENPETTFRLGQITIMDAGGKAVVVVTVSQAGWSCGNSLTDLRDGKSYTTVQIGTQCWMGQNLNMGTRVAGTANSANNSVIEKYCYNNSDAQCDVYGGLYQWNEIMNYSTTAGMQGICMPGWHLPTDAEWTTLSTYLGGENVAGGKMKETGTTHWTSPNNGATNSSGFTGLPGGGRNPDGLFNDQSYDGYWWSSTQSNASNSWGRYLYYSHPGIGRSVYNKAYGLSVRCLKDN